MKKSKFKRNSIFIGSLAALALGAGFVFATPPASYYLPGETNDPSCSPGDTNCDVQLETSKWTVSGAILTPKTATDDLAINTDNLYVDVSAGTVGMGTTGPQNRLHLHRADSGYVNIQFTNSTTGSNSVFSGTRIGLTSNEDLAFVNNTAGKNILFYTEEVERMRLDNTGNLGIGTSSPGTRLEVRADDTGTGTNFGQLRISGTSDANKRLNLGFDTTNDFAWIQSGISGVSFNDLLLNPNGGNIGINTSSPTAALDIDSNTLRLRTAKTPANASDTCKQGEMAWDSSYIYVCVADNTWKRSALSSW